MEKKSRFVGEGLDGIHIRVPLSEVKEHLAQKAFGRSLRESLDQKKCVSCEGEARVFRGPTSLLEYTISGLCQTCQDKVFDDQV